ncbi:hypothetical protein OHA21_19070 [Actinoplanes sp. NBC_00393]|uniref:hypothetical protein n=1 Tax=Actinoplanes sp. NBC_00393 TaxID=2975953 RepID=UPI002E24D0AB
MWVTGGAFQIWASFLERWAAGEPGDVSTLPVLAPGDFAGDGWARLMNRITEALNKRLVTWSETLSRELSAAPDEFAAARALNHARWGLPPIRELAAAPALPEEARTRLTGIVDSQVASIQQQLDEHVQRLRRAGVPNRAVEARLRTIRDNPLTAVTSGPHVTGGGWAADPTTAPRRRVIID